MIETIHEQLGRLLFEALKEDRVRQAELARLTGLSAKHINHMVHGKGGTAPAFEQAAFALGRRWQLTLIHRYD